MSLRRTAIAGLALCVLAGCSVTPPKNAVPPYDEYAVEMIDLPPDTPMEPVTVEPVEPVEPILLSPPETSSPPAAATQPPQIALAPPPAVGPPATSATPIVAPRPAPIAEPTEDQQLIALLADLQRFGGLTADEVKREINVASQALARQRSDLNRIRLAVLYTLNRNPQDDQRAILLFENVAKGNPGPTPAKQLAAVLEVQVSERQRAVRDEQARANDANRKLEALREMERALLRDRVRSGGGGGGGGAGGGSGR